MTPRVETHIRLGIRSVSPSDQSPLCPHEEILGEIIDFYFSPRKKKKKKNRAKCVPRRNAKKEFFSWADLCLLNCKINAKILKLK